MLSAADRSALVAEMTDGLHPGLTLNGRGDPVAMYHDGEREFGCPVVGVARYATRRAYCPRCGCWPCICTEEVKR